MSHEQSLDAGIEVADGYCDALSYLSAFLRAFNDDQRLFVFLKNSMYRGAPKIGL